MAGNYAAVFELSYCLTHQETTVWEMSLEEQRMRSQQQFAMLYYLGLQAGLNSVQAYNAAGSAIRMDGATSAPRDIRAYRVIITLIILPNTISRTVMANLQ